MSGVNGGAKLSLDYFVAALLKIMYEFVCARHMVWTVWQTIS